MKVFLIVMI